MVEVRSGAIDRGWPDASEPLWRLIVEDLADLTVVVDESQTVRFVSATIETALGYPPSSALGTSFLDYVHADDRATVSASLMAVRDHYEPRSTFTFRALGTSDRSQWLEAVARGVGRSGANPVVVITARDVTRQRANSIMIRRTNRLMRMLTAFDRVVIHSSHEQTLFESACQALIETGGYQRAWWIAVDSSDTPAGMVAVASPAPSRATDSDLLVADMLTGSFREALRRQSTFTTQWVTDQMTAVTTGEAASASMMPKLMATPVKAAGKILGVLVIAGEASVFEPADVVLIEQFADDLAHSASAIRTTVQNSRSVDRLERTMHGLLQALSAVVEVRDPYTAGHQRRVAELSCAIGREMGLPTETIGIIDTAAGIHDLGKIAVPTELLTRPDRLTPAEFDVIKSHAEAGYRIVKDIDFDGPVATVIRQHHERLDGSGYPLALGGEQILTEARVVAVADTVEAMSSPRPYRPARGLYAALQEIDRGRAVLYDPTVVDACRAVIASQQWSPG